MPYRKTMPCRGCGKEIMFIKTEKGKTMPVDPEMVYFIPDDRGSDTYIEPGGKLVRGREVNLADKSSSIGYTSHFATCPNADKMRKRGA